MGPGLLGPWALGGDFCLGTGRPSAEALPGPPLNPADTAVTRRTTDVGPPARVGTVATVRLIAATFAEDGGGRAVLNTDRAAPRSHGPGQRA